MEHILVNLNERRFIIHMDNEKKKALHDEINDEHKMVSGSAWMTAGSMISRILGALYLIPWMAWMGGQETGASAMALYQMGYTPYVFFLTLATAGVPSAISKQVSHYNAIGEYEVSKAIYKQGLKIMVLTGVLSAAVMYVIAPVLAESTPSVNTEEAALVMRSLAPALLIIPAQSVTRGFIQGHNRMAQPAISQIIEQIARITFVLSSVFLVRQVMGGEMITAVTLTTFAAFVGAVFSLAYLAIKLRQQPTAFDFEPEESVGAVSVSPNNVLKEIIKTSIPFIIIATGITLFQMIDQQTYAPLMRWLSDMSNEEIQVTYGITQGNAHRLIMVLTSFGTALSVASVPLISNLIAKGNMQEVRRQFSKGVQLLFFAMFPAAIGMMVVSEPLYTVFYQHSLLGTRITQVSAIMSIFVALYAVLGNVLQATNQKRPAIWALFWGFVAKIITQPLFIAFTGPYGMLYSAMAGFGVTCWMMLKIMHQTTQFSALHLWRRSLLLFLMSAVMGIVTGLAKIGLGFVLNYENRLHSVLALAVLAMIGIVVYGYFALRTRIADQLIGHQATRVRKKLRLS